MTRFLFRAAAALCFVGLGLSVPAVAQQTQPQPQPQQVQPGQIQPGQAAQPNRVLKATHGAWEVHCFEGTDTCAMQQFGKTADGKKALLVVIERLAGVTREGQAIPASMEVLAPLGVLIPYNVRLKIDQGEVQPVPLLRCLGQGCMARAPMVEQAVEAMKKGTNAKFGFFLTEEVLADVSLNGFTAAYNSLKPVAVQDAPQN